MKYLVSVLCLLGCLALAADACPPVAFNYGRTYIAPTYHAPRVAAYDHNASYFVIYGGSGTDAVLAEVKLLKAQLQIESLKTQLLLTQQQGGGGQQLGAPRMEQVPAPKSEEQVRAVFQSCAECHSGATAKGKLALFSGTGTAKLTPDQMGECIQRVLDGDMPKGRKLTDSQKVAVLSGLTKWPAQ